MSQVYVKAETREKLVKIQRHHGWNAAVCVDRIADRELARMAAEDGRTSSEPGGPLEAVQRHAAVCLDCAITYPAALGACPYCGRISQPHPPAFPRPPQTAAAGAPLKRASARGHKSARPCERGGRGGLGPSASPQTIPGGRVVGWECPACHTIVAAELGDCPNCAADDQEDQT